MRIAHTHKAIAAYYAELQNYRAQGVSHELALKTAFQTLLGKIAQERKWTLIPELTLDNGKRPDGAILRCRRGIDTTRPGPLAKLGCRIVSTS